MAGGKETPRQKMIGMMYLVLTALLALNVSKEILNSFILINESLETTNSNFESKNQSLYADFKSQLAQNEAKVRPYWDRAARVKELADSVTGHIEKMKRHLIVKTDKKDSSVVYQYVRDYENTKDPVEKLKAKAELDSVFSLRNVSAKDNYDVPTNVLIGPDGATPKEGPLTARNLANQLERFKDELMEIIGEDTVNLPAMVSSLKKNFNTTDKIQGAGGLVENWESSKFYHIPLAAVITNLSKMKTDVRNSEADVVKWLYSQIDAQSLKFNKINPVVLSNSNYVLTGDTFRAEVFLAAYDSTQFPRVYYSTEYDSVDGKVELTGEIDTLPVKSGAGVMSIPADKEGTNTLHGKIELKGPSGEMIDYPWKTTYQVAKPTTTIAATKMNVFYVGVPNPVSISAPGVPKEAISASISNGSIRKKGEGWEVNVRKTGPAVIRVTAEVDGEKQNMGKMDFRCKRIPDPVPYVGGKTGATAIKKSKIKATAGILAKMENFDFDVKVNVTSYVFSTTVSGGMLLEEQVNGNRFNAKVKNLLAQAGRNSKVYFEKIKVKMPDGSVRELPPVSLKIR